MRLWNRLELELKAKISSFNTFWDFRKTYCKFNTFKKHLFYPFLGISWSRGPFCKIHANPTPKSVEYTSWSSKSLNPASLFKCTFQDLPMFYENTHFLVFLQKCSFLTHFSVHCVHSDVTLKPLITFKTLPNISITHILSC